jgi:hypothetical protein
MLLLKYYTSGSTCIEEEAQEAQYADGAVETDERWRSVGHPEWARRKCEGYRSQ